jgi:hypothetical protein
MGQKGKSLLNESCARLNLTKTIWFDEILWVKFFFMYWADFWKHSTEHRQVLF